MNLSLDRKIYLMKLARQGVKITIPEEDEEFPPENDE